ncbi:MAG: hypothetical protein RL208_611 [Pseudomonadota bacterium]|jgi:predicted transposase YbfD/YdcC
MATNKNVTYFLDKYKDLIIYALENNFSEREVYNFVYEKEFGNYYIKAIDSNYIALNNAIQTLKSSLNRNSGVGCGCRKGIRTNSNEMQKIQNIRDLALTLDTNNEDDNYKIKTRMQSFIIKSENNILHAYEDFANNSNEKAPQSVAKRRALGLEKNGNVTVGVGFNMDQYGAKKEWLKVFPDNVPNFDDVYGGKTNLTQEESHNLFQQSFDSRYKIISKHYGKYWTQFTGNEQIAIINVGYTSPGLVTQLKDKNDINSFKETIFSKNMKLWIDTKNETYLNNAITEIKYYSGSQVGKLPALQKRRNEEAEMLATNKSPIYNGMKPVGFIWHHESVSKKPRPEHVARNGKVYYSSNPDYQKLLDEIGKYHCHCWAEFIYE